MTSDSDDLEEALRQNLLRLGTQLCAVAPAQPRNLQGRGGVNLDHLAQLEEEIARVIRTAQARGASGGTFPVLSLLT
jgi:hypothetical protein